MYNIMHRLLERIIMLKDDPKCAGMSELRCAFCIWLVKSRARYMRKIISLHTSKEGVVLVVSVED